MGNRCCHIADGKSNNPKKPLNLRRRSFGLFSFARLIMVASFHALTGPLQFGAPAYGAAAKINARG
jgi:hypothetical protein